MALRAAAASGPSPSATVLSQRRASSLLELATASSNVFNNLGFRRCSNRFSRAATASLLLLPPRASMAASAISSCL